MSHPGMTIYGIDTRLPLKLTIKIKIWLLCALCGLSGLGMTALLLQRSAASSARLTKLMNDEIYKVDTARLIQVTFKKQIQEWKDILLRGSDPQMLEKYRSNFGAREGDVAQQITQLEPRLADPETKSILANFQRSHERLSGEFHQALDGFVASHGKAYQAADQKMKGKDRDTTDLVDALVTHIEQNAVRFEAEENTLQARERTAVLIACSAMWIGVGIASLFIIRSITRPLDSATVLLDRIATGDLTCRMDSLRDDEIGTMAKALNHTMEEMSDTVRTIAHNSRALAASSEEFTAVSKEMSSSAGRSSSVIATASDASAQVSRNLQAIAAASEQMNASIKEIARNTSDATTVANAAMGSADAANATVSKLGQSSSEISQVLKVISEIASHTQLLALNAAIEAARAGEAGKGFSVVASEVKELAQKTAAATQDITLRIAAIQKDSKEAVDSIGHIHGVISRVSDIANTIASAVEEQSATTREISTNVQHAAELSSQTADNMTQVAEAALGVSSGAEEAEAGASELARLATQQQALISKFKCDADEERSAPAPVIAMKHRAQASVLRKAS